MKLQNKFKLFYSITIFLFAYAAQAQSAGDAQVHQAQIDQVIARLSKMPIVLAQLEQKKQLQGFAKPLRSQGHIIFWKGQGVHIAIEKPFFNAITITPKGIINWLADGTGIVAQEQSGIIQKEINKTLLSFLSADTQTIEHTFAATWTFEQTHWQLMLKPKLDMIAQHLREVTISGGEFMDQLSVVATNGDLTELTFSKQSAENKLNSADCKWFFSTNSDPSFHEKCQ